MSSATNVFNFEFTKTVTGGDAKFAKDIIKTFILEYLPQHQQEIQNAIQQNDFKKLARAVHKFHGALCYCGMPRLLSLMETMEKILHKRSRPSLTLIHDLYQQLLIEIDAVKTAYVKFSSSESHEQDG